MTHNNVALRATYTCQGNVGDLDNLLFYNVGTVDHVPTFSTAIRFLQFERINGQPKTRPELAFVPTAHAVYEVTDDLIRWNGNVLAERYSGPLANLNSPPHLWHQFKNNMGHGDNVQHRGNFRVQVIISAPVQRQLNLVTVTTDSILDGFISACHHRTPDDTDLEEVVQAASQCYGWNAPRVRELLLLSGVLGACCVPKRNRPNHPCSFKWHPDDHRLIAGQIIRNDDNNLSVCGRVLDA